MTVRLYQSTDGSAPVLTGEPGRLVQVLEACLVTGYGSKPGMGWEIDRLADHSKGALRSTAPGTTGCWLYLDDDSPVGSGQVAHAFGIEANGWDGFDGSDQPQISGQRFPRASQTSWGSTWAKSRDANSAPRAWVLVADEQLFWLFVSTQSGTFGNGNFGPFAHGFGDIVSFVPDDIYRCTIAGDFENDGSSMSAVFNSGQPYFGWRDGSSSSGWPGRRRRALARDLNGDAPVLWEWPRGMAGQTVQSDGGLTHPHPPDGGLVAVPGAVKEGNFIRGMAPGIFLPEHPEGSLGLLNEITDVIGAPGRTLLVIHTPRATGVQQNSELLVDITGPWR